MKIPRPGPPFLWSENEKEIMLLTCLLVNGATITTIPTLSSTSHNDTITAVQ